MSRSEDPGEDTVIVRWVFLIFIIFEIKYIPSYHKYQVCAAVSFSKSCQRRFVFSSFIQFSLHLNFSPVSSLLFSTIIPQFRTIKMKIFGPRHETNGEWRLKLQRTDGEQVSKDGDAWCTDVHDIDITRSVTISHKRGKEIKKQTKCKKLESLITWTQFKKFMFYIMRLWVIINYQKWTN